MCVDARLASVEHDIGLCIGSLLELEASDKWPDMVCTPACRCAIPHSSQEFQLSQALPKIATHHHDLLHVVQCLPMTVRGMSVVSQSRSCSKLVLGDLDSRQPSPCCAHFAGNRRQIVRQPPELWCVGHCGRKTLTIHSPVLYVMQSSIYR